MSAEGGRRGEEGGGEGGGGTISCAGESAAVMKGKV